MYMRRGCAVQLKEEKEGNENILGMNKLEGVCSREALEHKPSKTH